ADNQHLFKAPFKWLIFNNFDNIISPTTKILVDSDFTVATKDSNDIYRMKLIYKYGEKDTEFAHNDLGTFSNTFIYYNPFSTTVNRSNLMGQTLTVSYVITNPAYPIDFVNYRNQHVDAINKLSYVLILHMLEVLNCSKNFIQHQSRGYKQQNSYYDGGMFDDLQNGTAEIAGTATFYSVSRLDVVDYISIITPSDMKFILRAPPLSYVNNIFTLAFEVNVWYALYLIIGVNNNTQDMKPSFFDIAMMQIGAIAQQGSDSEPKSNSGRIAVLLIFLVSMFLYTAYSAIIVAFLQSTSNSIRTAQALLNSKISLGVEDVNDIFESQVDAVRNIISTRRMTSKNQNFELMTVENGIRKMRNEFFGFYTKTSLSYKLIMDTFQEYEKCGLIEMDYLNVFQPSISIKKYSAYKKIVKFGWLILNYINNTVSPTRKILVDSNFAIATKDSDNAFQLRLIYKLTENDTDFVYNELGKFSDDFEYYNHFLTAMNRSDLMGSIVTVSYVLTSPAYPIDFVNYRNQHIDGVSKLSYALVFHMLELLNCTKNFIERKSWGYKHQNATYYDGGMFGDIQNGTAEIAGTVAFYTFGRMEVVDYISVTTPSDMKFILRAPPLSYINNLFTLPFEINVWYGLYLITGFTIILLYVIVIYESKYKESFKKANNVENIKPTFVDVIMLQIGAITQQGSEAEPKSSSGRIAVFIVFLVLMFMYTAYAANIVVLLQSTSNSFQTVQDLLYSKINLGVEDIVYSKYYFENQQEPIRKAIYEQKIAPKDQKPNFFSVQDGIRKMRNEFFAFHIETTSGYKVVMDTFQEHEKCGLIEIDYLNTLWPSISVRKRSAHKEIVKVGNFTIALVIANRNIIWKVSPIWSEAV
ncbi:glutamate receptor 3-like, partial [Asbolus verrucosus]